MGSVDGGSGRHSADAEMDWPMNKDIRPHIVNLIVVTILPMTVIIYDLWLAEIPRQILGDAAGVVTLFLCFGPLLVVIYWLSYYLRRGIVASVSRIYNKVLTFPVGDALEAAMPLSVRPLERTTQQVSWEPLNTSIFEKYSLRRTEGVRNIVKVRIDPLDDSVLVEVMTSDLKSRITMDVIEAINETMRVMRLEDPPIDPEVERRKLEEHREKEPGKQEWSYYTHDGKEIPTEYTFLAIGVVLIFLMYLTLSWIGSRKPPHDMLVIFLVFGQVFIMAAIYDLFSPLGRRDGQMERYHSRYLMARAPYVTSSIASGLDREGIEHSLAHKTFMDIRGEKDVFELVLKGEDWMRIEVGDSPNFPALLETSVQITTSWDYTGAEKLKKLVDDSVMKVNVS